MARKDDSKIQIRNATNDFLVFTKENGGDGVDVLVADENVWLTQGSICSLYDTSKSTVSEHLTNIFASGELDEASTVRNFRTVEANGKTYNYKYYNLQAIIAVGFKVNSEKAVRFRAWASDVLADFAMKGYVLDKERLKNDKIFSQSYSPMLARSRLWRPKSTPRVNSRSTASSKTGCSAPTSTSSCRKLTSRT
jgi:hypothetical protein